MSKKCCKNQYGYNNNSGICGISPCCLLIAAAIFFRRDGGSCNNNCRNNCRN